MGVISYVFHIDFLVMYHIIGTFLFVIILFTIYFSFYVDFLILGSLFGTLVIFFVGIIVFKESGNGYNIFWYFIR